MSRPSVALIRGIGTLDVTVDLVACKECCSPPRSLGQGRNCLGGLQGVAYSGASADLTGAMLEYHAAETLLEAAFVLIPF